MAKILKISSTVAGLIILIMLLSFVALITLVSPNKLKPIITAQVSKYTGRQLIIDGDLSWTLYPTLAVKLNHATLSNPPQFKEKTFAEIKEATAGVKLLPLLHSSIEFTGITLSGLKLNLIVNPDGTTNWQDLLLQKSATAAAEKSSPVNAKKSSYELQIPAVDVKDASLIWNNLQTNQYAEINKFDFNAKEISANQSFPITSSFEYIAKNPTAAAQITIAGNMTFDQVKQTYLLNNLDLTIKTRHNNKDLSVNITSDLAANLIDQTLSLTQLTARLANLTLKGNVDVKNLSTDTQLEGHLQVPAFDLKALLQSLGQDPGALQSAKNVSADFDFTTTPKAASALQSLNLQGKITVPELQAAKLKATNVNMNANLKNGLLDLTSITASFYQGSLQSQAKINLMTTTPQISFQSKLENVQAEPLLTDLESQGNKFKIKGAGNIDVDATTSGMSSDEITRNLNGKSSFSFQNGVLDGINLGYLIDSANALLKGQAAPGQAQNQTNFGNLTGTAIIRNGIIYNTDLLLISPRFDTKGQGTIDLVNQQISYALQIKPKIPGEGSGPLNINNLTIPVSVAGNMSNPNVKIDAKVLTQAIAKQKIQQVQDKVTDQIKNKIPAQAGALLQNILGR